ncbi:hypothetical protein (nucleomorph) [Guillardia theta]|uniref:Uncharacterized protein n=1 Tax=Guillardia theta TaxID=55529 RepID=Q98S67_GUITH|nr:hypothetical protein GTHECHR3070 [Guillardia theta]AAK39714.1 hypothetical protein [Guillardia theta]
MYKTDYLNLRNLLSVYSRCNFFTIFVDLKKIFNFLIQLLNISNFFSEKLILIFQNKFHLIHYINRINEELQFEKENEINFEKNDNYYKSKSFNLMISLFDIFINEENFGILFNSKSILIFILDNKYILSNFKIWLLKNNFLFKFNLKILIITTESFSNQFSLSYFQFCNFAIGSKIINFQFYLKRIIKNEFLSISDALSVFFNVKKDGLILILINFKFDINELINSIYHISKIKKKKIFFFPIINFIMPDFVLNKIIRLRKNYIKVLICRETYSKNFSLIFDLIVELFKSNEKYFKKINYKTHENLLNTKNKFLKFNLITFKTYTKWTLRNELKGKISIITETFDLKNLLLLLNLNSSKNTLVYLSSISINYHSVLIHIKNLYLLGTVDKFLNITYIGKKIISLNISLFLGKTIILSRIFECSKETIIITSILFLSREVIGILFKKFSKLINIIKSEHLACIDIFKILKYNFINGKSNDLFFLSVLKKLITMIKIFEHKIKCNYKNIRFRLSKKKRIMKCLFGGFFLNSFYKTKQRFFKMIFEINFTRLEPCSYLCVKSLKEKKILFFSFYRKTNIIEAYIISFIHCIDF